MKNPYIIPTAMICAAILVGIWMLKQPGEPQKVILVQPPDISILDAAGEGNIEAVKQHLAAGTDVNAKEGVANGFGMTPLYKAVSKGHKAIVELLIANGADVNAKDPATGTLLHRVATGTLLHEAVAVGHKEIAELLIAKGADLNVYMGGIFTPLDFAIQSKRPEIADILRKHGGKRGEELKALDISIHEAAVKGNIESVKQHLAAGTDVNVKRSGWTPLHKAAKFGRKEIVELLITNGAYVNAKNDDGKTPIDVSDSLLDRPEITSLLRKHGGKRGEELKAEAR